MPRKEDPRFTVKVRLAPALYATIQRTAARAGKPLASTIVSLLWIACGQLAVRPQRGPRDNRC